MFRGNILLGTDQTHFEFLLLCRNPPVLEDRSFELILHSFLPIMLQIELTVFEIMKNRRLNTRTIKNTVKRLIFNLRILFGLGFNLILMLSNMR